MSHPDPLYDPDNSYEDDMNYDDYNDFHEMVEDSAGYHPDAEHEVSTHIDYDDDIDAEDLENGWDDSYDDSMDGDHESAFGSCGWGVDEYYNADTDYGDDW